MPQNDLIYDVGMFNAEDTAYYLHRGYRVVSIEANPSWAEDGRRRFADAVREGRLTVLNVAIGPEDGVAPYVINEHFHSWSTLNLNLLKTPAWSGMPTTVMEVRTVRFKDLLAEFGVPYYLKVDIETFDHYCLEDLDPSDLPRYASFEAHNIRDLVTMRDKGYHAFKVIRQQDKKQVVFDPNAAKDAAKESATGWPALMRALGISGRSGDGASEPAPVPNSYQPLSDWHFPGGSTGPFGEDTDGPWRPFEHVAMTWLAYDMGWVGPDFEGKSHDIHCCRHGGGD